MKYMAEAPPWRALIPEPNATPSPTEHDTLQGARQHRRTDGDQGGYRAARRSRSNRATRISDWSTPSGKRVVVLSHGHFIEPLYRAMSVLEDLFDRGRQTPRRCTNSKRRTVRGSISSGPRWVTAGTFRVGPATCTSRCRATTPFTRRSRRSGAPSSIARVRSGANARERRRGRDAADGSQEVAPPRTPCVGGLERERRDRPHLATSSGPVSTQVEEEIGTTRPGDVRFGHTHKPFIHRNRASGLPGPVPVINTGGWVVDTPEAEPHKGARSSSSTRISTSPCCAVTPRVQASTRSFASTVPRVTPPTPLWTTCGAASTSRATRGWPWPTPPPKSSSSGVQLKVRPRDRTAETGFY